jgi:hypothetical protein
MTPEEVHRMPVDQHRVFVRYQNHHINQMEKGRK